MFTIVDSFNREENKELLNALYLARYDAFVLGRGWSDLARPDCRDIDAFDDDDTVYIIGHKDGNITAGCRIRPSTKPHLLEAAFSNLVDGGVPSGDNVFECSRLFVERRHPERMKLFIALLLVTVDWYRNHNATLLTGVIESWWLNSFLSLGFDIAPLGKPDRVGRNSIVAVRVLIDECLQKSLRQRVEAFQPDLAAVKSSRVPPVRRMGEASNEEAA